MEKKYPKNWFCPVCADNGFNYRVDLKQISPTEALYICENKKCLYPLDVLKKFPIVKRNVGDIPVTEKLLRTLSLPLSLLEEEGLTECHIDYLIELNALKRHIKTIFEAKETWDSYIEMLKAGGDPVPEYMKNYHDSDLEKLQNIRPDYARFVKHIFTDWDEYS